MGRLAVCFALGAVVGTLLDGIHAYGDVLVYPDPAFGRWAWFVPLEFGLLGLGAALVCPPLERLAENPLPRPSMLARALELSFFAFLYFVTTLPGDSGWAIALALGLLALAAARLAFDGAPGDWVYVLLAAVLGPTGEAIMSALGAFDYVDPDVAGIPLWLPGLWANGGFLIRRLIVPIALSAEKAPMLTRAPRTVADRS
jgi:Protein of unknown function (DUF2878)